MPGNDPRSVRRRFRALTWAALVAAWSGGAAEARQGPSAEAVALAVADSIDLAADRVRYWDADGAHWALLEGRVAVLQGADGLRADVAVVRFGPAAPGAAVTRLEVYAEGHVRPTDDPAERPRARRTLTTSKLVNLAPYEGRPAIRLPLPLKLAIVERAFPTAVAAVPPPPAGRAAEATPPPVLEPVPPADRADVGIAVASPIGGEPAPPVAGEPAIPTLQPTPDLAPAAEGPATQPSALRPPPSNMDEGPGVALGAPVPIDTPIIEATPPADPALRQTQFEFDGAPMLPLPGPAAGFEDDDDPAPAGEPEDGPPAGRVDGLDPLPDPLGPPDRADDQPDLGVKNPAVVLPYTQRSIQIAPANGADNYQFESRRASDGTYVGIIRGGVNIVMLDRKNGLIDVSADNATIWFEPDAGGGALGGGTTAQDENKRLEVYLEGNVVLRQDKRKVAGNGDQTLIKADRVYLDMLSERKAARNAELNFFAPGLLAPLRTTTPRLDYFQPMARDSKGKLLPVGPATIQTDKTQSTGSRFPKPGYLFTSDSLDLTQIMEPLIDPTSGLPVDNPRDPAGKKDLAWRIDARQNTYWVGRLPVFYWPRIVADSDDLDPPLRNFQYRYGTYFGHQVLLDFNAFKLLGLKRPFYIDGWNLDVDYLSLRGPALGTEIGWLGRDIWTDLFNPYPGRRNPRSDRDQPYFGYFDIWGIHDTGVDVLGGGPAVVTYGPPGFGKRGFQRSSVPPPPNQTVRGRITARHMQYLNGDDDPLDWEDRLQLEFGYESDRHFLEEYYKRLFDSGLDQETLAYYIRQRENRAFTFMSEVNLMPWYTESQWFPKIDYYRLGDGLFDGRLTYSQHSGIDWANTHTANEVNNPNIFAFMPYDPVSNTSYNLQTGRAYTAHELDLPLNFDFLRVVPYTQGQLVGWNNQLGDQALGRAWGAVGAKANVMAWRAFPGVESELLNLHGLNHKINLNADYRAAFSNVGLNRIGVQDDLDDNTYEFVRRYFALSNYVGGVLPAPYDPRLLTLRRAISPIAGTTDIQASMQTLQLSANQRLQTRRGPEGSRRIVDYMILDLRSTYYPYADRDNFGVPFGQNQYNYEWYVGDRTSIISTGWFEFWKLNGYPYVTTTPRQTNDPFGLSVINTGVSINRPPRGNVYIGYSVVNTGPIATSAIVASYSYWLSPKWYSTFGTTYDFGNAILLGSSVALTRIGADFLTSVGLNVDPQRNNYTFGFEIVPRFSPQVRLGSASGLNRFDPRFAPTQ